MDKIKPILVKYWVGILCAIVALASVIASVTPINGYHEQLHNDLKTSASAYDQGQALLTKPRKLPRAPGASDQQDLQGFPSANTIASGQKLRDKLDAQSEDVVKFVVDLNHHEQIAPGVLPDPSKGTMLPLTYRSAYIARIGTPKTGSIYSQVLNAGTPPTDADITAERNNILETKYKPLIVFDGNGQAINADSVNAQFATESAELPKKMRYGAAKACKVYVDPTALPVDPLVASPTQLPPNPQQIWWSQMTLWVTEDACAAVAEANKAAPDVTQSPIKRLVKVDIPASGPGMLFSPGKPIAGGNGSTADAPGAAAAPPPDIKADDKTPIPLDTKYTPSGRVCCPMYDVIDFRMEMVVSAQQLPQVIQAMSRHRLMQVLIVESVTAEDTAAADAAGYVFGNGPVVRVVFRCETLFLREWTLPLMPDAIKRIMSPAAAAS